jgi:hypothetical protein
MNSELFNCGISLINFSPREFFCPCCGVEKMNKTTLLRIQRLRTDYGNPIGVIKGGGYRCEKYERSGTSAHREGRAVDTAHPRADHFLLVDLAFKHGFRGIGDKNISGVYQLHIDDAEDIPVVRPRPWKWTYA